ncbi:MAG: TIGR03943 family protein [Elainellaceae cyanobacterium]
MTVKVRPPKFLRYPPPNPGEIGWQFWLDNLAMASWGMLLLKYRISGQIYFLLHPNYIWLTSVAGLTLLSLTAYRLWLHFRGKMRRSRANSTLTLQHISFFPVGLGSGLLLAIAILGFIYTPRPFASDIALQRGVADTLLMTRSQPESFRASVSAADRSLIDWIRTLNVYPEPDAYTGDSVNVTGFAVYPPDLPSDHLMISRFVITCCAADAYPVGLPVKLSGDRSDYPADEWFSIEGKMITSEINGQRQLVIEADSIESIPTPRNPYDF